MSCVLLLSYLFIRFCLQMVEYLFFYRSQESNRRWSNRSAAVTDRLRLQPFWGLKHFSTNSKANASIFAMFAWLAIFAIFAIFLIFLIFAIPPISARFAIFKSPTIGNQTRFAINSIYLYSCDLFVWDSSGLTSSIQILPYQMLNFFHVYTVRSQMTVFIISLSSFAIEFDLE